MNYNVDIQLKNKLSVNAILKKVTVGAAINPSGIVYRRPPKLYGLVNRYSNDYVYYLQANAFDYIPPQYPMYYQDLDSNDISKLKHPNIHGTRDRFTDTQGGQTYTDGWVVDHYQGLEFYYYTNGVNGATWLNDVNYRTININGRAGRLASIQEIHALTNVGVYGAETFAHIPYFNTKIDLNIIRLILTCSLDMRGYHQGILGKVALSVNYGVIGYQGYGVTANPMIVRRIEKPLNEY